MHEGLSQSPEELPSDPVVVFIVSRDTAYPYRRVLWRVSRGDAMQICSDPRTGIEAHPHHMLCWTAHDIDDPELNRFVEDNGRYDDVLVEHDIEVLDSWNLRHEEPGDG